MIRFFKLAGITIWLLIFNFLNGWAAEIETTIKYVTADHVFLAAGTAQGIGKGDIARILLADQTEIVLEIVFVAENSASAKIIEGSQIPQIGDKVIVTVEESSGEKSITEPVTAATPVPDFRSAEPISESPEPLTTTIRGRFSVELFYQDDREPESTDVTRPALSVRSTVDNLFVGHLTLSINLRARHIRRDGTGSIDPQNEWNNRIYEIALRYHHPASPLTVQAGRISSNSISGIGRFDGAALEYQLGSHTGVGAFGGAVPDYSTSEPQSDRTTAGVYAAYERGNWQGHRVAGTLALAGRYNAGQIDREFVYQQIRYSWTRRITVYQSAEISVNRDWRAEVEGGDLSLSNFLLNATYSPTNSITLNVGFDNRQLMHTFETKDTPDSLFDDALRQGFRAGLTVKLPLRLRIWLRGGLRIREGETTDTRTLVAGLSQRDLFSTGVTGSLQVHTFDNRFSTGTQISLAASRYVSRIIYLEAEVGQSRYEFETSPDTIEYRWINLEASGNLSRHFYASSFGEIYRGDGMDVNRIWLEIGYRL